MTQVIDDDPFATADEAKPAPRGGHITGGRYRLPERDGSHHKGGWMRVSNLVSAYSDQFALRQWEQAEILAGLAVSEELRSLLCNAKPHEMEKTERKEWAEDFATQCKEVSGANEGMHRGNARHEMVDLHHAGLSIGNQPRIARQQLSLYQSALVRHKLRALPGMQERIIMVEALNVCGRLDNILEDLLANVFRIGDLKTQKRFWTYLEIAAQLATYAHGDAMWDEQSNCWIDMPMRLDREIGLVLWMPHEHECEKFEERHTVDMCGEPQVDVHEVDLVAGWKTAQRAFEVCRDRSDAKSKRMPRGWVRQAPAVTELERYAARFAAIETRQEGAQLVAEAHMIGLWGPVLSGCALEALARISAATA